MSLRGYLVTQHRLHDPLTKMDVPVPSRIRGVVVHDTTDDHTADAFKDEYLRKQALNRMHGLRTKAQRDKAEFKLPDSTSNAQSGFTWKKIDASKTKAPVGDTQNAQQLAERLMSFYYGFETPEEADNLMSTGGKYDTTLSPDIRNESSEDTSAEGEGG